MTVNQLLANTTAVELAEWRAFFAIEAEDDKAEEVAQKAEAKAEEMRGRVGGR